MKRFVQNNDNHVNQVLISSPYIHLELRSEFCFNFFGDSYHRRLIILIIFLVCSFFIFIRCFFS